jgi:hypothetical protein
MSTWLTTIVKNCARMQLRRRPRQSPFSLDQQFGEDSDLSLLEGLADNRPSPEVECQKSELRAYLMDFIEHAGAQPSHPESNTTVGEPLPMQ